MKIFHLALMLYAFLLSQNSEAQLIWSEPSFPLETQEATLYYNAAEGNQGVMGVVPMYIHTGVITNFSSGPSDWRHVITNWGIADANALMTYVSPNVWSFDFGGQSLADFYNLSSGEHILSIAAVFRNTSGSMVGRAEDGGDIYFPIGTGAFEARFELPLHEHELVSFDGALPMRVIASEITDISLMVNGSEVANVSDSVLNYSFQGYSEGEYEVIYSAGSGSDLYSDTVHVTVAGAPIIAQAPPGIRDGINYIDDQTVVLQLYAPEKEHVFVIGDFNNWQLDLNYQMHQLPDGATYWIELDGLNAGQEYRFHYYIFPDQLRIGDAYAEKYLIRWLDDEISETVYPNLQAFPAGLTSDEPVSVFQTAGSSFNWTDQDFVRPEKEKLIIYELLVRDFTAERTFSAVMDTLDYLKNLGVNAIEMMPVIEFNGNNSWGYNNSMYFAPDKAYGTKVDLQALINAAHERGIAVIMDVAFNHADWPNPFLKMYWQGNAPAVNNPWFNRTAPHALSWYSDWNHESAKTKEFVKRFIEHWVSEYHVDGWRWDFTQGFTQTNTINGSATAYDQSRINNIEEYGNYAWSLDPDLYMILEHWCDNDEETVLANAGYMLWGNIAYNYQEAAMGYSSNFNWSSYANRGWQSPHLITYMESHDEERLMYKNLHFGSVTPNYSIQTMNTALKRIELTACFHTLLPGPKMIWEFGELGYDYSINTCTNGTVADACRLDPKPVRWDYYANASRYHVYKTMAALNALKTNEAVFSSEDFDLESDEAYKWMHWNTTDVHALLVGNFGVSTNTRSPQFAHSGMWYEYFSGDSLLINATDTTIALAAGEYRLYTDVAWAAPDIPISVNEEKLATELWLWPNPGSDEVHCPLVAQSAAAIDLLGRRIVLEVQQGSLINTTCLSTGAYVIEVVDTKGVMHRWLWEKSN